MRESSVMFSTRVFGFVGLRQLYVCFQTSHKKELDLTLRRGLGFMGSNHGAKTGSHFDEI